MTISIRIIISTSTGRNVLKYRPGPRKSSIYTIFRYITNPGLWLHMAVFYNSFPERHGTMTADRGARQTARGPPPTRLVAPPTPPRPEMGRPPSLPPTASRVGIQTRAQSGHAGPGSRIPTVESCGNHPNGAPPRRRLAGRRRDAARLRRNIYCNQYLSFSGCGRARGQL